MVPSIQTLYVQIIIYLAYAIYSDLLSGKEYLLLVLLQQS